MSTSSPKDPILANKVVAVAFILVIAWGAYIWFSNCVIFVKQVFIGNASTSVQAGAKIDSIMDDTPPAPKYLREEVKSASEERMSHNKSAFIWPPEKLSIEGHHKIISLLAKKDTITKSLFLELNTIMHHVLKIDAIRDDALYIIKQENGALAHIELKDLPDTRGQKYIEYDRLVRGVKALQDTRSADVLVVRYPEKPSALFLSAAWQSYLTQTDEEYDKSIELLSPDVSCLNLVQEASNERIPIAELQFKSDHHWTPEGAFWAFQKVAAYYKSKVDLKIPDEYLNIDNYVVDVYSQSFVGSSGERVGVWLAGKDDFSLIYPRFKTSFELWRPQIPEYAQGDFKDVFFIDAAFEVHEHPNTQLYSTYLGNNSIIIVKNNKAINDKRLLLVRDSFANVIAPFLCLLFEEIHIIDPRHYRQSVADYVEYIEPDCVMFLVAPRCLIIDSEPSI